MSLSTKRKAPILMGCSSTAETSNIRTVVKIGNNKWLNVFLISKGRMCHRRSSNARCYYDTFLATLVICVANFKLVLIVIPRRVGSSLTGIVV